MDVALWMFVLFVLLPLAIGLLAGAPWAYGVWATLVTLMAIAQGFSGEVQFFTVMVVFLGTAGAFAVLAGVELRRRVGRRRGARGWRGAPERP